MFRYVLVFAFASVLIALAASARASEPPQPDQVKAAVLRHFPPQYSTSPDGAPQGFAIDVLEEIAKIAHVEIEYVIKEDWQSVFESVKSGEADLIPNQGITERRKEWFSFTSPVETFPVSIFTRETRDDLSSLSSLDEKTVAVIKLNVGEVLATQRPAVRVDRYDHIQDALLALLSGNVDALIYPEPVLWKLARDAGIDDKIKTVGRPLTEIRRAISVARGNQALLDRMDAAVKQFVGTETYRKIYVQWYGRPEPFWSPQRVAGAMAALLVFMVLVMGVWRYVSVLRLNRKLTESIKKRDMAEQQLQEAYTTLEQKVSERTRDLQRALSEVRALSGLLPICSHCKRIRDDKGYWNQLESYIQKHSEAEFSHSICKECAKKLYPDLDFSEDE